jgi:hypothetical protein
MVNRGAKELTRQAAVLNADWLNQLLAPESAISRVE